MYRCVLVGMIAMTGAVQVAGQQAPLSTEQARVLEICRERLRVVPTDAYFFGKMVGIHRSRGALPDLLEHYLKSRLVPDKLVAARLLTECGRAREAQQRLTSLRSDPRWSRDAHLLLARLLARRMMPRAALEHYQKVLANAAGLRGREKILLEAAGQAMQARRQAQALRLVSRIQSRHRREAFYRQHGMTSALVGSLERRWQDSGHVASRLGISAQLVSLAARTARHAACARHASYILDQTAPGHWTRRQLFATLQRLARNGGLAGQLQPALRKALVGRPRDTDLRLLAARVEILRGKTRSAIELLRVGLELSPGAGALRVTLADLLIQAGQTSEAERLLLAARQEDPRILMRRVRLALETDPTQVGPVVRLLAGSAQSQLTDLLEAERLLCRLGRIPSARVLLSAATARWPGDFRPLIRLAQHDEQSGNKAGAIGWARKICRLRGQAGRRAAVRILARCGRWEEAFSRLEQWSADAGGAVYLELASALARARGEPHREQGFLLARLGDARPEWVPVLAARIALLGSVAGEQTRHLPPERLAWIMACRLIQRGQADAGLGRMTVLAQRGPPVQLLALGRQARRHGNNALARDAYAAYLQTPVGQGDRQAALELSALMMIDGEPRALSRWFAQLIGRFPQEVQVYLLQADIALRNDDWPEALDILGRGLVACGEQSRLLLALGQIRQSLGQHAAAAAVYRRLASASQGEFRRTAIRALLALPGSDTATDPVSLEVQVRRQLHRGEREQALRTLRRCVARYPDQPALLRLHGQLQLVTGRGDRSARLLRRVLLMNKRADPALVRLLARSLAASGKTGEARRMVDRLASRRPLARARAYMACGLFGAAIEELEARKREHGGSTELEQLLLVAYLADGRDAKGQKLEGRK